MNCVSWWWFLEVNPVNCCLPGCIILCIKSAGRHVKGTYLIKIFPWGIYEGVTTNALFIHTHNECPGLTSNLHTLSLFLSSFHDDRSANPTQLMSTWNMWTRIVKVCEFQLTKGYLTLMDLLFCSLSPSKIHRWFIHTYTYTLCTLRDKLDGSSLAIESTEKMIHTARSTVVSYFTEHPFRLMMRTVIWNRSTGGNTRNIHTFVNLSSWWISLDITLPHDDRRKNRNFHMWNLNRKPILFDPNGWRNSPGPQ